MKKSVYWFCFFFWIVVFYSSASGDAPMGKVHEGRVNVESGAGRDRYSGYGPVNAGLALAENDNISPVAKANGPYAGQTGEAVAFSSSGSHDPDGSIVDYAWFFGDGSSSDSINPSHVFMVAGIYKASLTVTDNQGSSATDDTTVIITGTRPTITEESEPNDDYSSADGPMGSDQTVSGYIDGDNADWFYLDVQSPGTLHIVLQIGNSADLDWFLHDADRNQVARGYSTDNPESGAYNAESTGRYYLQVNGYRGVEGPYTLTVSGNVGMDRP